MASPQDPVQAGTQPFSTFHLFPSFPMEIRLHIWEATYEPRLVEPLRTQVSHVRQSLLPRHPGNCPLQLARHSLAILSDWEAVLPNWKAFADNLQLLGVKEVQPGDRELFRTMTIAHAKPPVALWVNRESRATTLKAYELCWGLDGGETHVWFNFELDTLVLPYSMVWLHYMRKDLIRLQTAVYISDYPFEPDLQELASFPPLRGSYKFKAPPETCYTHNGHHQEHHQPNDCFAVMSRSTKLFPALNRISRIQIDVAHGLDRGVPAPDSMKVRYSISGGGMLRIEPIAKEEARSITQLCLPSSQHYNKGAYLLWDIVLDRTAQEHESQDHDECSGMHQQGADPFIGMVENGQTMEDYVKQFANPEEALAYLGWMWFRESFFYVEDLFNPVPQEVNNMAYRILQGGYS